MNVSARSIKEQGAANGTACFLFAPATAVHANKNRHALQRPVF